jgi:hypothetical protein
MNHAETMGMFSFNESHVPHMHFLPTHALSLLFCEREAVLNILVEGQPIVGFHFVLLKRTLALEIVRRIAARFRTINIFTVDFGDHMCAFETLSMFKRRVMDGKLQM